MVTNINEAKKAAKRMHMVLKDSHHDLMGGEPPKLSRAQKLLAVGLGVSDWHVLEETIKVGSLPARTHAQFMNAVQTELEHESLDRPEEIAIDLCAAMIGNDAGVATPEDAIRGARHSTALLSVEHGWFPGLGGKLAAKNPRGGARRIDGMHVGVDVRNSREDPEDLGLHIMDGVWHLHDDQGAAAMFQAAVYSPEWELEDSEAVLAADAESDYDADVVSAIVGTDPHAFMAGGSIIHVRGLEVRPDLRGREIATKLIHAAILDVRARRKVPVVILTHDAGELLEDTPASRVTPSVAELLPATVAGIMKAITRDTGVHSMTIAVERSTHAQNLMRVGHLISGGTLEDEHRVSPEHAAMRMMRSQSATDLRMSEMQGASLGVVASEAYPHGRGPYLHKFPNIVIDPPADLLGRLGEGAVKLEIVTAPKRLNQVVNYTDEPGSYRVHYADGGLIELRNAELEREMSEHLNFAGSDKRRGVAAANLRLVVRKAADGENDLDADIVHRRVLTRQGLTDEVDPPLAIADAIIHAVRSRIDGAEMDRRYQAVADSIVAEGMLVNQKNAMAELNGGRTIPWAQVGIVGGKRYDPSTTTLLDLFDVPLSPTVERFYEMGYDRLESMTHRIIEVAKNYLCEVLDRILSEGVGGGVTRDQLALDIRFVRSWRYLTRDMLMSRIDVPMAKIADRASGS